MLPSLEACVTKAQVDAVIYLNNTNAIADLCTKDQDVHNFGFYRKLNSGQFEFISFCDSASNTMLSMTKDDYEKIMQGLVPKP
jgi:hypothetical protein